MLSEPGLSYLGRYRAIGLLYVRDLGTDETGVFDHADHVERLSDAGADEIVVGTFGQEWVATVRTGHPVPSPSSPGDPRWSKVLAAGTSISSGSQGPTTHSRAQRPSGEGRSVIGRHASSRSSSRQSMQPVGSPSPGPACGHRGSDGGSGRFRPGSRSRRFMVVLP